MSEEFPEVTGTITIHATLEVRKACDDFMRAVKLFDFDERDYFALRLSLEEALTNSLVHGNKEDPSKAVRVDYSVYMDRVEMLVTDEGEGFDFTTVKDCTKPQNVMLPGGRGVCLMKKYMDKLEYRGNGNSVFMVRFKGSDKTGETSNE